MRLQFGTFDVFTTTQFAGNPLGVVLNAEGCRPGQMQSHRRRIQPGGNDIRAAAERSRAYRRSAIFTPRHEMPFAGHPNVGTAFVLARKGKSYGRPVVAIRVIFEEKAGLVPIKMLKDGATVRGATRLAAAAFGRRTRSRANSWRVPARCRRDDIRTTNHRPCIASCGAPFILAELKSRAALARASERAEIFGRKSQNIRRSILVYTQVDEGDIDVRARMFAPHRGIPEDPATGSANVALIGLLAKLRPERICSFRKRSRKASRWAGRASLQAEADKKNGIVTATYIGGRCVPVMSGTIDVA